VLIQVLPGALHPVLCEHAINTDDGIIAQSENTTADSLTRLLKKTAHNGPRELLVLVDTVDSVDCKSHGYDHVSFVAPYVVDAGQVTPGHMAGHRPLGVSSQNNKRGSQ
jgi:hypothetical protein